MILLIAAGYAFDISDFKEVEDPMVFITSLSDRMFVGQFSGKEQHRLRLFDRIRTAWDSLTVCAKLTDAKYEFQVSCKKCGCFVHEICGGDTSIHLWDQSIENLQLFMILDTADHVTDDRGEW